MIKSIRIFWFYLFVFFLTLSTISTTLVDTKSGTSIISTIYDVHNYMRNNAYYETYQGLSNQLNVFLSRVDYADKMNNQPYISQYELDDIQKLATKLGEFTKDDKSRFDIQTAIENLLNKKTNSEKKLELKNVIKNLNNDMTKALKKMLSIDLTKAVVQTSTMVYSLWDTWNFIEKSEQFRQSPKLQSMIKDSKVHVNKAEYYYRSADDEIQRLQITSNILLKQHELRNITWNLQNAKFESEWAYRDLNSINDSIHLHLETLSSAKYSHLSNFFISLANLIITILEYAQTPKAILTITEKLLFAGTAGLHTINAAGHATGFHWTHEEIAKIKEYKQTLDNLNVQIKNSLDNINYTIQKLEILKQSTPTSFD